MVKILKHNVYNIIFEKKKGDKCTGLIVHANNEIELFSFIGSDIIEKGYNLRKVSEITRDGIYSDLKLEENELYENVKYNSLKRLKGKEEMKALLNLANNNPNLDYFAKNICNKIILKTNEYVYNLDWAYSNIHFSHMSDDASNVNIGRLLDEGSFKIIHNKEDFSEEKKVLILKGCCIPVLNMLTKYTYADDFDFKETFYYENLDANFKSKISEMKVDLKVVKKITNEPICYCDITIDVDDSNKDSLNNLINTLVTYHKEVRNEIDYVWRCCIPF